MTDPEILALARECELIVFGGTRYEVALHRFAAAIAERCAGIAENMPIQIYRVHEPMMVAGRMRKVTSCKPSNFDDVADQIRADFPAPVPPVSEQSR